MIPRRRSKGPISHSPRAEKDFDSECEEAKPRNTRTAPTSTPSDLREKTSDLREKTSDLREKTSDLREKTSDLREKTSDLREKTSDLRETTSADESAGDDAPRSPTMAQPTRPSLRSVARLIRHEYGPNMGPDQISLVCKISSFLDAENHLRFGFKARFVHFPPSLMDRWLRHDQAHSDSLNITSHPTRRVRPGDQELMKGLDRESFASPSSSKLPCTTVEDYECTSRFRHRDRSKAGFESTRVETDIVTMSQLHKKSYYCLDEYAIARWKKKYAQRVQDHIFIDFHELTCVFRQQPQKLVHDFRHDGHFTFTLQDFHQRYAPYVSSLSLHCGIRADDLLIVRLNPIPKAPPCPFVGLRCNQETFSIIDHLQLPDAFESSDSEDIADPFLSPPVLKEFLFDASKLPSPDEKRSTISDATFASGGSRTKSKSYATQHPVTPSSTSNEIKREQNHTEYNVKRVQDSHKPEKQTPSVSQQSLPANIEASSNSSNMKSESADQSTVDAHTSRTSRKKRNQINTISENRSKPVTEILTDLKSTLAPLASDSSNITSNPESIQSSKKQQITDPAKVNRGSKQNGNPPPAPPSQPLPEVYEISDSSEHSLQDNRGNGKPPSPLKMKNQAANEKASDPLTKRKRVADSMPLNDEANTVPETVKGGKKKRKKSAQNISAELHQPEKPIHDRHPTDSFTTQKPKTPHKVPDPESTSGKKTVADNQQDSSKEQGKTPKRARLQSIAPLPSSTTVVADNGNKGQRSQATFPPVSHESDDDEDLVLLAGKRTVTNPPMKKVGRPVVSSFDRNARWPSGHVVSSMSPVQPFSMPAHNSSAQTESTSTGGSHASLRGYPTNERRVQGVLPREQPRDTITSYFPVDSNDRSSHRNSPVRSESWREAEDEPPSAWSNPAQTTPSRSTYKEMAQKIHSKHDVPPSSRQFHPDVLSQKPSEPVDRNRTFSSASHQSQSSAHSVHHQMSSKSSPIYRDPEIQPIQSHQFATLTYGQHFGAFGAVTDPRPPSPPRQDLQSGVGDVARGLLLQVASGLLQNRRDFLTVDEMIHDLFSHQSASSQSIASQVLSVALESEFPNPSANRSIEFLRVPSDYTRRQRSVWRYGKSTI